MKMIRLFIEDLSYEHIDFCDNYIKKVIINAKRYFYRPKSKVQKYDIVFVGLGTCENELTYEEKGFEDIFATYITVKGTTIPVYDPDLADALFTLTEMQRTVVLRNIVLGDSLTDIAKDSGVSIAMISKHKQNALKIIKERMSGNHEQAEKDRSAGGYHFGCDQR